MQITTSSSWIALAVAMALASPAVAGNESRTAARDGQCDFDFTFGRWKIQLRKLKKPLSGSKEWVEYSGTTHSRPLWDGKANIEEFAVESRDGARIEGLTLRLYSPASRQWSLYWANKKGGQVGGPPNVGEFKNGRGEFFSQETYEGRTILVRYVWSGITASSAHFEQSFSTDGGKTWEVNWITDQTRVK